MIAESVFNESSVEEYLAFLLRRGRKETTVRHLRYTIRKGGEALRKAGAVDPYEVDGEDIIAMEQLLDLKESTRKGVVITTGCYLRWLTGRNPAEDAAILWNEEAPSRKWITPEEYKRMMSRACPWMRLVLALGATMGLRRTEMASLALGDVEDGCITIHGKGRGKEGKVVTMAMSEAVRKELDAYLRVRKESESDAVLISCQRKAMNPGSIANAVVKLGRECGVELSMHSLRRLYAMTMADAGVPLETMARMMRHATPEITMRCYLKADPRRMATAQDAVDAALACRRPAIKYPVAHYCHADREDWRCGYWYKRIRKGADIGLSAPTVRFRPAGVGIRMEKIGIDKVCQHIERQNCEKIELAREKGIPIIPYTADDFSNDAAADCFICSAVTVKSKWKALQASGIVVTMGGKTCLDVSALSRASTPGVKGFARGCA